MSTVLSNAIEEICRFYGLPSYRFHISEQTDPRPLVKLYLVDGDGQPSVLLAEASSASLLPRIIYYNRETVRMREELAQREREELY